MEDETKYYSASNGKRPYMPLMRDELDFLKDYTPEQLDKLINDIMPKIDWNKSFNELLIFGTTEIKIK
jgi:hypothetical protein